LASKVWDKLRKTQEWLFPDPGLNLKLSGNEAVNWLASFLGWSVGYSAVISVNRLIVWIFGL
jgi:hypothetical protein